MTVVQERHTCKGALKIAGTRGKEAREWVLGQANWGLRVRPHFVGKSLSLWEEGQRLAANANMPEAVGHWQEIAAGDQNPPIWLRTWLALHAAELLAKQHHWKDADQEHERAVELAKGVNAAVLKEALYAWAETFLDRSDWNNAEKYYKQALDEAKKTGAESLSVANYFNGLSTIALRRGDLAMAEHYSRQDLAITEQLAPDSLSLAATLTNLGGVALRRGELTEAEKHYRRSLSISERLAADSLDLAYGLNNLASLLAARGQFSNAEEYHRRSLAIVEKVAPHSLEAAGCLHNLGTMARQRGDLEESEAYLKRALEIKEKLAGRSVTTANTLLNLGKVAYQREELTTAETWFRQAMGILTGVAPNSLVMAESLSGIGDVTRNRGDLTNAESYYRKALSIREALAPGSRSHAENLAGLAQLMQETGNTNAATSFYERFLTALESQAARLGGGEEVRHGFRARYGPHYEGYINLLLAQKRFAAGFGVVEQWRARTLLETLASGRVNIRKGIEQKLLERDVSLRASLAAKADQRVRLLMSKHTPEELAAINEDIATLRAQKEELEADIRNQSPSYAALTLPRIVTIREVQEELLDDETALLEFSLGNEHSYVWMVSTDSVAVFELPPRAEIEKIARRLYETLTVRTRSTPRETSAQRRLRLVKTDADCARAAAELSRLLLEPIALRIRGKRLLIVSDGALQYIPLGILPTPRGPGGQHTSPVPLAVEHEIINLPSASVLAQLRREGSNRRKAPRAIAVIADPVFDRQDARVTEATLARGPLSSSTAVRSLRSVSPSRSHEEELRLPRLPFTRQEADTIVAVAQGQRNMVALDFKANLTTVASKKLSQYRIVHFGTHGLLDSSHPELSGLVLSMVNERGMPRNGFLGLEDIYNLDLPAELVVLSGCETALGKEIQGEGLIGLTRGFMYAGAARVLASLWKVDDPATAELMGRFYRGMIRDRMTPAAALRSAQIQLWRKMGSNGAFYWGAFQIYGDWN